MYEPLAFRADERRYDVAELAGRRFSILLHVLLTFSANAGYVAFTALRESKRETRTIISMHSKLLKTHICAMMASFPERRSQLSLIYRIPGLLKFCSTICAFDHRKRSATLLKRRQKKVIR